MSKRTTGVARRPILAACGALALSRLKDTFAVADVSTTARRFRISACDWSLDKPQNPDAFRVAAEIGLDGVEVSFGKPGDRNDLRDAAVRKLYLQAAREHKLAISSLAMGVLNSVPYAVDPRTEKWDEDAMKLMPKLGVNVCLLAFFGKGDIKGDRAKQDEVIRRLKRVASKAEAASVVLGIESTLNADEHIRIVDSVASPAVKVYYDVCNMQRRGYDIYKEIRQLRERICQFHMKEYGCLLGEGPIDFKRVKEAIDDIGYRGWLVIEGAKVKGKSLVDCYRQNQKFLRQVFGA